VGLGLAGAAFLCWLGARTLWQATRVRVGAEADGEVLAPAAAFRTSVIATASNPMTIASWAAIFSAASVGHVADSTPRAAALLLGVGVGSFLWFATLSTVTGTLLRRRACLPAGCRSPIYSPGAVSPHLVSSSVGA